MKPLESDSRAEFAPNISAVIPVLNELEQGIRLTVEAYRQGGLL